MNHSSTARCTGFCQQVRIPDRLEKVATLPHCASRMRRGSREGGVVEHAYMRCAARVVYLQVSGAYCAVCSIISLAST